MAYVDNLTKGARRILDVATDLFYDRGIHGVGVDLIAKESGVTKRTLYDRFGDKETLVLAYLRERDGAWRHRVEGRASTFDNPADKLLAPFDELSAWVADNSRGCAFINVSAELPDLNHPGRRIAVEQKLWLRQFFAHNVAKVMVTNVDPVADELLLLHEGALALAGVEGTSGPIDAAVASARGVRDRATARRRTVAKTSNAATQ